MIIDTVTLRTAPLSRSTACSALWATCVCPSFIFVTRASGSCGCVQSAFDVFFFRGRSNRAIDEADRDPTLSDLTWIDWCNTRGCWNPIGYLPLGVRSTLLSAGLPWPESTSSPSEIPGTGPHRD